MKPVFIIGCQRTGSTMLSNLINRHSNIDILGEVHLIEPFWIHNDFVRTVKNKIGNLQSDENIYKLVNMMSSGKLFGPFWESFDLNRKNLIDKILRSDRSLKSIFTALLSENMITNGKTRCGAKFPVHFSYINILLNWFPNCKIIHMVRDVRGIYSSQANKYLIRSGHAKSSDRIRDNVIGKSANKMLIKLKMLLFICIQFPWASKTHTRFCKLPNYKLLRYEDLIANPDTTLKELCGFLGIEFKNDMLYPRVINSSFVKAYGTEKGFNIEMIDKWKDYVSPLTEKILIMITRSSMKRFGY